MWITKVIFKGYDGNATTTIEESTDEQCAQIKYSREIEKWLKSICQMEIYTPSFPNCYKFKNNHRDNISLEIIQLFINAINKENNNTNMSFEISMYEEN